MAIARISSDNNKPSKANTYLNHDISRKVKKQAKQLKFAIVIILVSLVFNIYQFIRPT